jgi:hypothetical protein
MSHFSVLVIGDDVETQLAPYHEYECDGVDDEYIQTIDVTTEKLEEYQKDHSPNSEGEYTKYDTFREYLEEYCEIPEKKKGENEQWGYFEEVDGEIKVISRTNPNAKYDYWRIGGRWSGSLKLKKGFEKESLNDEISWDSGEVEYGTTSQALKKHIDFSIDEKEYKNTERFWELVVEELPLNEGEEKPFNFYKKEYYLNRYKDKETYTRLTAEFSTFAVVKDGIWYEKGEMGWFGMSSESNEDDIKWKEGFVDKWIKDLPEDTLISIVDCHI